MYSYQTGGTPQQEIITVVAQAIKQGVNPNEIMKRLVKMGMSQDEAMNMVRSVAQSVQQTEQDQSQMEQQGSQMTETMKGGGTTMSGTSWYAGGGSYIPSYGEYAYGGYRSEIPRIFNQPVDRPEKAPMMAGGGSFDNPGFEALPEFVQEKIMRGSGKAMYGMGMMANGGPGDGYKMPRMTSDNTRTMARQNANMMSDVRDLRGMKKEYMEGFEPRYRDLRSSSNTDTPDYTDSFDYRNAFQTAPALNLIPHKGSNYDYNYYPTELDYRKAVMNTIRAEKMMEGNSMGESIAGNQLSGYEDWQDQFRNKYYDSTGKLKKQYSKMSKIMNIPKQLPKEAEGGQMPQWLAERRFAAAGNIDKMSEYGYADGGEYNIGDEIDVTPEQLEMLKQQGYKFEILD